MEPVVVHEIAALRNHNEGTSQVTKKIRLKSKKRRHALVSVFGVCRIEAVLV